MTHDAEDENRPLSPAQQAFVDRGYPISYETARRQAGVTRVRFLGTPEPPGGQEQPDQD